MASKITIKRQLEIDKKVSDLLLSSGRSYPENTLREITDAIGLDVYISDFEEHADSVSGVIIPPKTKSENTSIYLNENHSKERQTFTLAHELGHYYLHNGKTKLRIDKYNYSANSKEAKEETEANYFAATLLMPKDRFMEIIKSSVSFSQVANYFAVSEIAARNRWRWIQAN